MLLDTPPAEEAARFQATQSAVRGHAHRRWYRAGLAYGRLVHQLRWLILALWVIGLVVAAPFAAQVASALHSGGYAYDGSESAKASQAISRTLGEGGSSALVVFQSDATLASDPAYQQEVAAFVTRAQDFPHVVSVTPGGTGQDGRTTYIVVGFDQAGSIAQRAMPDFHRLLPTAGDGPARAYLTGGPEISHEYNTIVQGDVEKAEMFSLPIALVVLLIVFGTLLAAVMPLVLALVAVPVALAVIYGIALHTDTSIFVLNVASVIGLGIAIDYSLFMVRRFREELARGADARAAVAWTVATTGEAILFSGLTVIIGFAGLLLIGLPFMTSFGVGGAVTVAAAVLGALTLLPALLGILGPRINALRLPILGKRMVGQIAPSGAGRGGQSQDVRNTPLRAGADDEREERGGGFWRGWALGVMRRPVLVLLVTAALLVALGWPIFSMKVAAYGASALPASSEAQHGSDILTAQFPAAGTDPIYVVARTPDGSSMLTPDNLQRVDALTLFLAMQSHVTDVASLTHLPGGAAVNPPTYPQLVALYSSGQYAQNPALAKLVASTTAGDTTIITVRTDAALDSDAGTALVDAIRAGDKSAAQGLSVLVGGTQAQSLDFTRYLYSRFPLTVAFILLATYILLLLMFRSAVLPLKAVLVNVLSLGAAYGVLVWVFQWGNFSDLLGFTSAGMLDATVPILIFCILFGLSMDYEVFLLSRIREEWLRTGNNREAVARGLAKTAGVITNAALLFVIVTGAFTFTQLTMTKEIGLGMTVAVLVDATLIRTLLVPATMRLLGRWNWWLPGKPLPKEQSA
jgi:RND superfamily putative drug exporter